MNTATASHRIQALSALSLALLIGTSHAAHRSDSAGTERSSTERENSRLSSESCPGASSHTLTFQLAAPQTAPSCLGRDKANAAPIRLARPMLGGPYLRSAENIRYSF
jgi:hypothetical protein